MAEAPSDVLAVEYLQRAFGSALRVVPLFEEVATLERAGESAMPRRCVADRDGSRSGSVGDLEVMIGYSDSAKDGGRLAANWSSTRRRKTSSRRRATPACR